MTMAGRRLRRLACVAASMVGAALLAAGCASAPEPTADDGVFRVALLHPGPISDGGWNASAFEGLERIEKELGAKISHVQTSTPSDFEDGFRDYARQGFDLVFGHGFEFQDAAIATGEAFPDTHFVVSSGSRDGRRVGRHHRGHLW